MQITLGKRTAETVAVYFERAQQPAIRQMLPRKAQTLEEALADFARTQLPGATSFGRTILVDGRYVGDVWCYGIDPEDEPNAMLSYCVFEPELWGKGVATEAVRLFLAEAAAQKGVRSLGAFTYAANLPSIRVLKKNCFAAVEEFVEDGVASCYFQRVEGPEKGFSS